MNRLLKLMTTLLAVVVLFSTNCKKNVDTSPNNDGGTPHLNDAAFFIDVDFLPETETNGEVVPRLIANFNDEAVMIEIRPSADTLIETLLFLCPDNEAMLVCGDDSLMICAAYDMATYTPSDDVLLVTLMDDNALLLTKCVMDWNTNTMTTGDMMVLPIENDGSKKIKKRGGEGDDFRVHFMNHFMKQLVDNFEQVESFFDVLGLPHGIVVSYMKTILTTSAPILLFSDDPELLYDNMEAPVTMWTAQTAQTGILSFVRENLSEIASKMIAVMGWSNAGGHGSVNDYEGGTNSDILPYARVLNQSTQLTTTGYVVMPEPAFIVSMNVSNITESSAYLKGSFRFGSSSSMTPVEMGYVYKVSGGPEYIVTDMNFQGLPISGLQKATKYSARAYVKSLMESYVYSPEVTFWTLGFEAFPTSLNFPAEGDSKSVGLSYSEEDITDWEITSSPSWCTITKDGDKMFTVTVGATTEDRSGTITVTGYSNALGSVTQYIAISQVGSNPSGFFAGTPFNNTSWNMSYTIEDVISYTEREKELHNLPNGNSYYTYYTETHTENNNYNGVTPITFNTNTICIGEIAIYEFKEDSIILKGIIDGQEYIVVKCHNDVAVNIQNLGYPENYEGTITYSRYFVDNDIFCMKIEVNYTCSEGNDNDWIIKHYETENLKEFKITNDHLCTYNETTTGIMSSDYGSEYTGEVQNNSYSILNGSGTWEYGVKDNVVNSGNNTVDFLFTPKRFIKQKHK